jgi:hypothetical protein
MRVGDTNSYIVKTVKEIKLVTINTQHLQQSSYSTIL